MQAAGERVNAAGQTPNHEERSTSMEQAKSPPVKRHRGRSANHCTDPIMPPPMATACGAAPHLYVELARMAQLVVAECARNGWNPREIFDTAAQMAIEEGPIQ